MYYFYFPYELLVGDRLEILAEGSLKFLANGNDDDEMKTIKCRQTYEASWKTFKRNLLIFSSFFNVEFHRKNIQVLPSIDDGIYILHSKFIIHWEKIHLSLVLPTVLSTMWYRHNEGASHDCIRLKLWSSMTESLTCRKLPLGSHPLVVDIPPSSNAHDLFPFGSFVIRGHTNPHANLRLAVWNPEKTFHNIFFLKMLSSFSRWNVYEIFSLNPLAISNTNKIIQRQIEQIKLLCSQCSECSTTSFLCRLLNRNKFFGKFGKLSTEAVRKIPYEIREKFRILRILLLLSFDGISWCEKIQRLSKN